MPKMRCKCGTIINLSLIPDPNEWLLISDVEFDSFADVIDHEVLMTHFKHMILCDVCGRLWIYWKDNQISPTEYCRVE